MRVVTISLKLENGQIRVITETKNDVRNQGIDLNDGVSGAAKHVRKEVLGEIAGLDWAYYLETLVLETD